MPPACRLAPPAWRCSVCVVPGACDDLREHGIVTGGDVTFKIGGTTVVGLTCTVADSAAVGSGGDRRRRP